MNLCYKPTFFLDSYEKPFLYPIGSLTQKNFKIKLKENNIDVDEVLIYKTKPHHELEENILKVKIALNKNSAYFIYFSPSGVNFTLPLLKKHEVNLETVKVGIHLMKEWLKLNLNGLINSLL